MSNSRLNAAGSGWPLSNLIGRPAVRWALACLLGVAAAVLPAGPAAAATWSVTPPPGDASTTLLGADALSSSEVWAVGLGRHPDHPLTRPFAARWNGSAWTVTPTPVLPDYAAFHAVDGSAPTNVWAVGSQEGFIPSGSHTDTALTERWNGSAWTVVPSPLPPDANASNLDGVKTLSATNAWAVGSYRTLAGVHPLIQRWNGSNWTVVPGPSPAGSLLAGIDGTGPDNLWAAGSVMASGGTPASALVLHWNGTAWSRVTVPAPAAGGAFTEPRVQDVVVAASNSVWVVGSATERATGRTVPYYLYWDGQTWRHGAVLAGIEWGFEGVAALSPTKVYAFGNGTIARWTGSAWARESATVPGTLTDGAAIGTGTVWTVGYAYDGGAIAMRTTNG